MTHHRPDTASNPDPNPIAYEQAVYTRVLEHQQPISPSTACNANHLPSAASQLKLGLRLQLRRSLRDERKGPRHVPEMVHRAAPLGQDYRVHGPLDYGVRGEETGREDPVSNCHGTCRRVENL
jgi:hypothetical protein